MTDSIKKKVLVITEVFAPEDFLINDLVFSWEKQGYLVSVLTRNPSYPHGKIYPGYKNKFLQKEILNNVIIYRVQFIPGYKTYKFIKILNYFWNMFLGIIWGIRIGKKYDSIFIYHTGPLTFSSISIFIKKLYKNKITIWTQDVWPDTVFAYGIAQKGMLRKILVKFVKWVYGNCDNITVSCPGFIPIINKYCPSKEIKFIPQWSNTPKYDENKVVNEFELPGVFNFVFAGNIGKVQNLENVIIGFEQFIKGSEENKIWLNIIGDGSNLYYLQNIVLERNIKSVKFWGRLNSSEMPTFYNKANVLIISLENQPIFNLTIPSKFQSYLNAEKPIFGIIGGEVADLINNNNLGWVAEPDNIIEIAKQFAEIISCKPEEFTTKTMQAHKLLEEKFNRDRIIKKFTELVYN